MLKRILVALDPDADTDAAIRYAITIARHHGALVSGLAVVDTRHIAAAVGPGGAVGGMYYAEQVRHRLGDDARATAGALVASFTKALTAAGIPHESQIEEGVPDRRILENLRYHDLLILGSEAHFHYDRPKEETNTLARIVKRGVAPTLVVGDHFAAVQRVVVAYDGSDAAARTLQRFAQLAPFGRDVGVVLVHVRSSNRERAVHRAALLLREAASYLRDHGYAQVEERDLSGGEVARQLADHAREAGAGLIVAGTHSVSTTRRLAFGSVTHALLHAPITPLLLFH